VAEARQSADGNRQSDGGDAPARAPAVQEPPPVASRPPPPHAGEETPAGTPAVQEPPVGGALIDAGVVAARRIRRHHAPEIWKQARRDYEVGGFTAPAIAEWYEMSEHAVKRRARVEGWSKLIRVAPPPLFAPPDPAQVVESGDREPTSRWIDIAHPAQLPPEGTWSTWLFQGGRGAGKTRAGAEWLAARAEAEPGLFALVGPTQHDVREVMIDGPSGLRFLPGRARPHYERSRRRLLWPNGAVAYAFSAEEPERLRGPQFEAAWADEFAIWPKPAETLAILRMGLRRGTAPQLVVTTTPKPIPALRKLRAEPSCVMTQAATALNAAHLAPTFLDGLNALYGGTRLAAQELDGLLLDGDGALWRAEDVAAARGARPEKLERVVVGVDPPAGHMGAACGVVVAGRAGARGYVLADRSQAGLSPLGWAMRVAEAAREFGAAEIVAEANQGGDMVRATLARRARRARCGWCTPRGENARAPNRSRLCTSRGG
jgi:phage terminase large subunit-like protein